MKNKLYDFKNCHLNKAIIMSWFAFVVSIINIFVDSVYIHGVWLGLTFYLIVDLILNWIVISHNHKVEMRKLKEEERRIKTLCGFREDFDWETRFELKTRVGKYIVSTVDLGLDHSFGIGKPLYYETMIFRKGKTYEERHSEENPFEYYQERYTTEEEAREGHKAAIKYVKEHLKEEK